MVGVVFGFLYWRAVGVVESQAADTVASELRSLAEHFSDSGLIGLVRSVGERSQASEEAEPVYLVVDGLGNRSEEHTSELQSLMRISYAVFFLKKKQHHYDHEHRQVTKHNVKRT